MNKLKFYFWLCIEELWNKRWVCLLLAWGFSIISLGFVFSIPNEYQTRSSIYIDTDQLLSNVLRDSSANVERSAQSQAQKVHQMIYATDNLRKVLRSVTPDNFNLSPVEEANKIEEMYSALKFQISGVSTQRDFYEISYTHKDPVIAYKVLKQILDLFIETNIRQMSSKNERSLSASEDNLKIRQKALSEAQAELAKFKQNNLQLTESGDVLFGELTRLEEVVRNFRAENSLLRTKLTSLTSLLSQTPRELQNGQLNTNQACDFFEIQNELTGLMARGLTEKHPDVIHYQNLLARKKNACKLSGGDNSSSRNNFNPAYLQLAEQVSMLKSDIQSLTTDYKHAKARILELESLLDRRPVVMEKLRILKSRLKRASEAVREANFNNDVIQGTIDLNRKSGLISYEIIEEIQMPVLPTKPNRFLLVVGAFMASFMASISYVLLKLKLEQRMSTVNILRDTFDLPVLGSITAITKSTDKNQSFDVMTWGIMFSILVLSYAFILKIVKSGTINIDLSSLTASIHKLISLFI